MARECRRWPGDAPMARVSRDARAMALTLPRLADAALRARRFRA